MKILILGSLPKTRERKRLYEVIISVAKKYAKSVSSPIDTAKFSGSDQKRYQRALEKVKEADLIIGEQSEPSTGQGIEIGHAAVLNKPLLVVAKKGSKVSGLVKGCPILKGIIYYESEKDLALKMKPHLERRLGVSPRS